MLFRIAYSILYAVLLLSISGVTSTAQAVVSSQDTITPPPPPPTPSPADPNAISNIMCGQDLNNNGYAGDPGEVAHCIQTAQGQFCPVSTTEFFNRNAGLRLEFIQVAVPATRYRTRESVISSERQVIVPPVEVGYTSTMVM